MASAPRQNVILMGPPGAGKSSAAKYLGRKLEMPVYDIDDDHLEQLWGCSVAEKLAQVGDEQFVIEEGKALGKVKKTGTIISLTGSNPLAPEAIDLLTLNSPGIVIFMDVDDEDILRRLEMMKVTRIVGQATQSMRDILKYRRQFYERAYDLRVLVPSGESVNEVGERVYNAYSQFITARELAAEGKGYVSTRGVSNETKRFGQVVLEGLAPDGGLYVPTYVPRFELGELARLVPFVSDLTNTSAYPEVALRVLERWIPELHPRDLRKMVFNAYKVSENKFTTPHTANLVALERNQHILELFNGPTGSFKDFALQLFPQFFDYYANIERDQSLLAAQPNPSKYCILVSTSGDTGSATADGFCTQTDIPVIILYPADGVSPVQKAQMVPSAAMSKLSVLPVADADFDFCQSSLKTIFNDNEFIARVQQRYNYKFSAANSINWGRLVPQIVYNVYTYVRLVAQGTITLGEPIDICIPCGNFGNILGAVYAKESGIPFRKLIVAANENDVLNDFMRTGVYDIRQRSLIKTSSPSIDILKSSNLERMLYIIEKDPSKIAQYFADLAKHNYFKVSDQTLHKLQNLFWSSRCSQDQVVKVMKEVFVRTNYLLDPHTAVAKYVADEYASCQHQEDVTLVVYSTAHYVKFPILVLEALSLPYVASDDLTALVNTLEDLKAVPEMHQAVSQSAKLLSGALRHVKPQLEVIKAEVEQCLAR